LTVETAQPPVDVHASTVEPLAVESPVDVPAVPVDVCTSSIESIAEESPVHVSLDVCSSTAVKTAPVDVCTSSVELVAEESPIDAPVDVCSSAAVENAPVDVPVNVCALTVEPVAVETPVDVPAIPVDVCSICTSSIEPVAEESPVDVPVDVCSSAAVENAPVDVPVNVHALTVEPVAVETPVDVPAVPVDVCSSIAVNTAQVDIPVVLVDVCTSTAVDTAPVDVCTSSVEPVAEESSVDVCSCTAVETAPVDVPVNFHTVTVEPVAVENPVDVPAIPVDVYAYIAIEMAPIEESTSVQNSLSPSSSYVVTMNLTDDAYDPTCLSNVSLAVVEGFDHLISANPCSSGFVTLQQPDRSSSDSFSSVMNPLLLISNEPVSTFSDNLSVDQSDVVETPVVAKGSSKSARRRVGIGRTNSALANSGTLHVTRSKARSASPHRSKTATRKKHVRKPDEKRTAAVPIPSDSEDSLLSGSDDNDECAAIDEHRGKHSMQEKTTSANSSSEAMKKKCTWKDGSLLLDQQITRFLGPTGLSADVLELETPLQFFRYIFTNELFSLIVEHTNLYSVQQCPSKPLIVQKRILNVSWVSAY